MIGDRMGSNRSRPHVDALFPESSEYADFFLHIERPIDEHGRERPNSGWDFLIERKDGSALYNEWADDWDEVLLFFAREEPDAEASPWVVVGLFKDAIFPDE